MDIKSILVSAAFIINLFLSLLIYFRAKRTPANISLMVLAFAITGWCFAMVFYIMADKTSAILWAKLLHFFAVFTPTSFLLFGLYFPKDTITPKLLNTLIIVTFIMSSFALLQNAIITDVLIFPGADKKIVYGWAHPLYLIYFPLVFLIAYYVYYRKYLNATAYVRMQILYILLGCTATSLPAMITNLALPAMGYFGLHWVGQLFTMFWIGCMAYAIIKHRLLDIRLVVARAIIYILLVVFLGFVYALGIFLFAGFVLEKTVSQNYLFVSTIFALFIAFTVQPLKNYLESVTDKIFFKGTYNSNELVLKLTKIMASTLGLEALTKYTLHNLLDTMRITRGAFVLLKKDGTSVVKAEGYGTRIHFNAVDVKKLLSLKRIIVLDEEDDDEISKILRHFECNVIVPLLEDEHKEGLLILGEKKSGEIYLHKDIQVLEIFGPEVSVALTNAESYEEINKFNVTLKEEITKATKDLKNVNERLKELDVLKNEFVSVASHELRTPMTAIKSYLRMALDWKGGQLMEKQRFFIDRAYQSVDRLIKMVNDMLNISRIESGKLTIHIQSLDLKKLIQEVVEEVKPRANELGLHVDFHYDKSIPTVAADTDKIKEVIFNLVGNAMKFTNKEGTISISLKRKDDMVIVKIIDTGVGLDPEDLSKLFRKFGLLPGSYTTNQTAQGTGLGLYICKSIIDLHEGTISATSEGKGKGTEFSFGLKVFTEDVFKKFSVKFPCEPEKSVDLVHN